MSHAEIPPLLTIIQGLGITVRQNTNRRTMLSLRQQKTGDWHLSIHRGLLEREECHIDILQFVQQRGRGNFPQLRTAMQDIALGQAEQPPADSSSINGSHNAWKDLETIGDQFQFSRCYDLVHEQWFSNITKPPWHWSRDPGNRRVKSLRFGAYHSFPQPIITLSPRLKQPWIPAVFVEFIFFHELCHHRQYCAPIRGEAPHSQRFRAWEKEFPQYTMLRPGKKLTA